MNPGSAACCEYRASIGPQCGPTVVLQAFPRWYSPDTSAVRAASDWGATTEPTISTWTDVSTAAKQNTTLKSLGAGRWSSQRASLWHALMGTSMISHGLTTYIAAKKARR